MWYNPGACNLSTEETEAGGWRVLSQSGLHRKNLSKKGERERRKKEKRKEGWQELLSLGREWSTGKEPDFSLLQNAHMRKLQWCNRLASSNYIECTCDTNSKVNLVFIS